MQDHINSCLTEVPYIYLMLKAFLIVLVYDAIPNMPLDL